MTTIDEIRDNFELLEEWDDRYRYVIELGRTLEPMSEAEHSAANKVQGCASQVWLSLKAGRGADSHPVLTYVGDSDAHIVRGLIAILLTLFSGRKPQDILTPTRSPSSMTSASASISRRNGPTGCARWSSAFAGTRAKRWLPQPEVVFAFRISGKRKCGSRERRAIPPVRSSSRAFHSFTETVKDSMFLI